PAAEERDQLGPRVVADMAYIPAQERERRALGAVVVLERLPVQFHDLPGCGRTAPQHDVHALDAAAHLMDPLPQMVGDLLDERVVEHPALLGGKDLLPISDL